MFWSVQVSPVRHIFGLCFAME